jgi:hypothetical protein
VVGLGEEQGPMMSGTRGDRALIRFLVKPFLIICGVYAASMAEPVVINGSMIPALVGTPIAGLRMVNSQGNAIPFQVDEITKGGEYVCPQGEMPNADSADGKLDRRDEIVFLWEDATTDQTMVERSVRLTMSCALERVTITKGSEVRYVWISNNRMIPLSTVDYITYDHERQYLKTPFYYAQFRRDRFHFIRAGVMDFGTGRFLNLTNELKVVIALKALWGLLPITYTEENIVCSVKRYKTGPLRLIRRGDFYLKLGLGIKGSRAVVYQICYPQLVKVPVRVHVPVRFRSFFSDAYIEMTPVLNKESSKFRFIVPSCNFTEKLTAKSVDTLINSVPDKGYIVSDGIKGFGWITQVNVDPSLLSGSGYVLRRPSKRGGIAECGFKLTVRDLPKGSYNIINWVFFSKDRIKEQKKELLLVLEPAVITTDAATGKNLLISPGKQKP